MEASERPVVWVGSIQRDVRRFPARFGATSAKLSMPSNRVKPIQQSSHCEVLAEGRCLRLSPRITATHGEPYTRFAIRRQSTFSTLFQKKSKSGIATPKKDVALIRQRLGEAERLHRERQN